MPIFQTDKYPPLRVGVGDGFVAFEDGVLETTDEDTIATLRKLADEGQYGITEHKAPAKAPAKTAAKTPAKQPAKAGDGQGDGGNGGPPAT